MTAINNDITFAIAGAEDQAKAVALRRSVFLEEYGHDGTPSLDSAAYHLVAKNIHTEVIAALRVLGPEHRPFDFEDAIDIRSLVENRRPALVGGLCVRPDQRNVARVGFVSMGLFKFAYRFACQQSFSDLIAYVQINHRRFYEGCFFETVVDRFTHPKWGPMCLMRLDISTAGDTFKPNSFARFLGSDFS